MFVEIYHDDDFDKNWKYICNYYKAAFGKKYTESDWGSLMFSDLDIPETVVIDMSGETSDIWIQILSSEYEKETHEVSSASITSAFNSITYKYDGTNFGMNLKKLLDLCVENQKVYYDAAEFCSCFGIERKCALFAKTVLVKGGYYGIIHDSGSDIAIQDLPFEYCRSRFKNH